MTPPSAEREETETPRLDPITLEIVRNQLEGIAEEMGKVLIRSASSPNIKERRDCSTALFDANGRLVAQAEHIPVHLGAMPAAVEAVRDCTPPPAPGDVFILNDPFTGGTHLPDVTLVSPIAPDGEIIAYAVSRAHHADVGGSTPGSMPAGATELFQEGIRIPPTRLVRAGEPDAGLLELLLANVRNPDERRADLRAQVAANDRGGERVGELLGEYGSDVDSEADPDADTAAPVNPNPNANTNTDVDADANTDADADADLEAIFDAVRAYSRERIREEIRAFPDGTYHATDALEGDGVTENSIPLEVTVTVEGATVAVDFAGTAPQVAGNMNAPLAVATSAVYFVIRSITDPEIPPNGGCYEPISVSAPEGSLLNPRPPAAVVGGNVETSQRVTDVVFSAFAECVPDRVPAQSQGTMNNLVIGSRDAEGFTYYETIGGGFGARPAGDGIDGVQVGMTNTLNTPVESLETEYPLRVERYGFRPDSGGDGQFRGGVGLERSVTVKTDAVVSLLTERRRVAPKGIRGGTSGAVGRNLIDGDPVATKLTRAVEAGTTITVLTPGGGGYGKPADREQAARERDRADGKVGETASSDDQ